MQESYDAIVLMGPPGSGKSYLGNKLDEQGIATYQNIEPVLRKKFGTGEQFLSRLEEVGIFIRKLYLDQLKNSVLPVVFESSGVRDRFLLRKLKRRYKIGIIHVKTKRSLCIDRIISRQPDKQIWEITDKDKIARNYDLWQEQVLPIYDFELSVNGSDDEGSITAIRNLLNNRD